MNLLGLSASNLKAKPLNTLLSLILFALGVALISFILQMNHQLSENLRKNVAGIDLVVGAKGSPLQLILSSIYHVDFPTGNISLEEAKKVQKNPLVKSSIPLAMGDNFESYRIIGTTHDYVKLYNAQIDVGFLWKNDLDVTVGAAVAEKFDMHLYDKFVGAHGLTNDKIHVHDDQQFRVVGILKPTGSIIDQLILTNVSSVWRVHEEHDDHDHDDHEGHDHGDHEGHDHGDHSGHDHGDHDDHDHADHSGHDHESHDDHEGHDHAAHDDHSDHDNHSGHDHGDHSDHDHGDHDGHDHSGHDHKHAHAEPDLPPISEEGKEITSLLIEYRNPIAQINLPRIINSQTNLQAASPAFETARLMSITGMGANTLKYLAYAIIFLSGLSVFISLFGSLKDRKYELALMRVMGASKTKLFILTILQGLIIAIIGFVIGIVISHLALHFLSGAMAAQWHYSFSGFKLLPAEWAILAGALVVGFVAALFPAIVAYKTDISKTLSLA